MIIRQVFKSKVLEPSEPTVKSLRLHGDAASDGVLLALLPLDLLLQELEVGNVTSEPDDGRLVDGDHALQVREPGQGAVGAHRVGGDDHAVLILDGEDRRASRDRGLRVGLGMGSRGHWPVRKVVVAGRAGASGPEWRSCEAVKVGGASGHGEQLGSDERPLSKF